MYSHFNSKKPSAFWGFCTKRIMTVLISVFLKMRYVFFDIADPNDTVCVNVDFVAFPLGADIRQTASGTVSNAYPNPANTMVTMDYNLVQGVEGSIVIRNILGSTVKEMRLDRTEGKATINVSNLDEGVYFYTLLVNNTPAATKKLVVRH